jgi:hypothetical protein
MTRPHRLSAHKTLWSVVVYRPKPRLVALFETKAEAHLAARVGLCCRRSKPGRAKRPAADA